MNKVTLPKEVAEAIEKCRQCHSDKEVVSIANSDHHISPYRNMQDFANEDFETFLKALVNGYEVEQTPEDNVKELYLSAEREIDRIFDETDKTQIRLCGFQDGIIETLNALNITIKGVNAE